MYSDLHQQRKYQIFVKMNFGLLVAGKITVRASRRDPLPGSAVNESFDN